MRKTGLLIFGIVMILFIFSGCSSEKTIDIQFKGNYTLIRSDYDFNFPVKTAVAVRNALNDAGADVTLKTDFVSERTGDIASDNELLIGPTEREESVAALEEYKLDEKEFIVKPVGTRIVLLAGCDNAYFAAAEWLAGRYNADTGVLSLPEDGYTGRWTPVLEGLTIDGTPVGEYTIVYGNALGTYSQDDVAELQDSIYQMTGERLPAAAVEAFDGGKAIRLCASADGRPCYETRISLENGDISISAATRAGYQKLYQKFRDAFLSENSEKNISAAAIEGAIEMNNPVEKLISVSGNTPEERGKALIDAIKSVKELENDEAVKLTIELADGEYLVTETLEVSDSALASLTIKAAEGAHPVINGAVSVPDESFVKVEGTDYYMAKIDSDIKVRDIFVDGRRLPLARSESKRILVNFDNTEDKSDPANAKGLYLDAELVGSLGEVAYPTEFVIYVEWEFHRIHVAGVDLDDTKTVDGKKLVRVKFDEKEFASFPGYINAVLSIMNREYYFENNVSLLKPGTCVADYSKGVLYYYPENGEPTGVTYSTNEVLMSFKSVANLSVEGVSFTGSSCNFVAEHGFKSEQANADKNAGVLNCAAILLTDCLNTKITGCSFSGLGGNGIQSRRSQNGLTITDCVFDDLSMSAMALGEHTTDWSADTADYDFTIDNNRITNVGFGFPTAVAIYISHVDGLKLTHNTIDNCAYSGVSLGWGWSMVDYAYGERINVRNAELAYNHITNFMRVLRDGAAIYVLGANCTDTYTELFNEMHDNYAENPDVGETTRGYYLDGSSSNWYVHDNVISGAKHPFFAQFHVPSQYNHNVKCERIYTTDHIDAGNASAERNVIVEDCHEEKDLDTLFEKYPEAKQIKEAAGAR